MFILFSLIINSVFYYLLYYCTTFAFVICQNRVYFWIAYTKLQTAYNSETTGQILTRFYDKISKLVP